MNPIKKGDRVQLLDEDLGGRVLEVSPDGQVRIETPEGFELELPANEVVLLPEKPDLPTGTEQAAFLEKTAKDRTERKKRNTGGSRKSIPVLEVDLHLEKLLPRGKQLSEYEALDFQLDTAEQQLAFAMRKRIQRVVFIHGLGEGVLKAELHTRLRRYEGLTIKEADYRNYGSGATEVYIPQRLMH
ncbi:Smr/MutS family protein [Robiginitalea sp. IMCC43444]|uniref:Smr/MutS family protein n=1 Tax=Robiginitalea sp. IMCC43444 TaxID=3459121 RepID=UPI0040428E26